MPPQPAPAPSSLSLSLTLTLLPPTLTLTLTLTLTFTLTPSLSPSLPLARPYYYGWYEPPPQMSLPEAFFSFVFGDGDPNAALRAARVQALAGAIRQNGGAVVGWG